MKKICFVGAPSSGKTTLSARMFAEFLERGNAGTGYIQEYAREYIGAGGKINDIFSQKSVSETQISREEKSSNISYNVLLCDSAIWLGSVYLDYRIGNHGLSYSEKTYLLNPDLIINEYKDLVDAYLEKYDYTIYCPLFTKVSNINDFRIHDNFASEEIDKMICEKLSKVSGKIYRAPRELANRDFFIKYVVNEILDYDIKGS